MRSGSSHFNKSATVAQQVGFQTEQLLGLSICGKRKSRLAAPLAVRLMPFQFGAPGVETALVEFTDDAPVPVTCAFDQKEGT